MKNILIVASALLIVAGRLSIPTRHNFSYAGFYETMAHFWVAAMVMIAYYSPKRRWSVLGIVLALSAWELFLVVTDKPALVAPQE